MIRLIVMRKRSSYQYKAHPERPDSFSNNWKNNSQDDFILMEDGQPVFQCKCQSVANYCFGEMATADTVAHGDTVAPGEFSLRLFVPPRKFHGEIHGICKTKDLDGQWIDHDSMQTTKGGFQNGRWLVHDRFSFKIGADTNHAWSAGCFILSSSDLERFNTALRGLGFKAGDELPGLVIEMGDCVLNPNNGKE